MKKFKNCTNIFITILLACTILITGLSAFVRFVLTDKNTYLTLLEKTNTYSAVTDALYGKMNAILGNDISEDLKKSIITEVDVKREAEVVIDCMISNLKNGQAIVPEINTDIYKERIADVLKTLTGYESYMNGKKELASSSILPNYTFETMNLRVTSYDKADKNSLVFYKSEDLSDDLFFENLATRAELEAQGRAMLRERGMTEAQARAKLAEKGISESQVWQYLKDNGYLDSEEDETLKDNNISTDSNDVINSSSNSSSDYSNSSVDNSNEKDKIQATDYENNSTDDGKVSKKKIQNIVMGIILDNSTGFDEKMNKIYSELMNQAEIIINKELDSMNFSKLLNSNIFNASVKLVSSLYKSFYINIMMLAVLIIVLALNNKFNIMSIGNYLSMAMVGCGVITTGIFGYTYLSKFYESFSGIINKSYFQAMFLSSAEYFCRILFIASVVIFVTGLIMSFFTIKKRVTRRK